MKLVIDTNTLISGALWVGPPARLLSAALSGKAQMFLSLPMLLELREVLQRPKFASRLAGAGESPDSLMNRFRAASHEAPALKFVPPPELRDPDDAHALACAVAAGAELLVTGDKDLLSLGSFEGVQIVDAAEALRRMGLD